MKPFIAVFMVVMTCGVTQSYSLYGNKRFNRANVAEPMMTMPMYTQPSQAKNYQPQYLSVPYPLPRLSDEYNYNSHNSNPNPNPSYYYYPRQDYQTPLYGIPTYRGDYQPKPYYFAQPSYSSDDRIEATNPLDYLHEEILQENERERSINNAAFMHNLALFNKVDGLQGRQQQLKQFQDYYNIKSTDPDDYDIETQPQNNDWYDQTSIVVDPDTYENYKVDYPQQNQYPYDSRPSSYDDEVVRELQDLTKQNRKSSPMKSYDEWQSDEPMSDDDVVEPEYDENEWINWGQKRNIQPKKDVNKVPESKSSTTTTQTPTTTTEKSKLVGKLHRGQKEVVLPRPATPVRKPFSEPIMQAMKANNEKPTKFEQTPPIYKTIKQIIDMEQNLSHLSNNEIPTSKIRKRFVTNEEALVQQLNGLKRSK